MQTKTETTTPGTDHREDAAKRLAELKNAAADHVAAAVELVTDAIKKHPLVAVGIGFGIGYIAARILSRD